VSGLLEVEEARRVICAHAAPLPAETAPIEACGGRVLAEPVVARTTQPPNAVSAMDGYAVRFADVRNNGAVLSVIGEAPAGGLFEGPVGHANAVRIFTGGVVPPQADHIVIQEDVDVLGEARIRIRAPQDAPAHIRPAGLDFRTGDVILPAGATLDGARPALAAAANLSAVSVRRRPVAALLATGDELIAPGAETGPGRIVSSTPYGLARLIEEWGGAARYDGLARDDAAEIRTKIDLAEAADVIVPIGGASVGDYDLVKSSLDAAGLELVFSKVAVKPGKPTWFGKLGPRLVLGLPGNPASALVCAYLFLKPLLYALTGRDPAAAVATWPAVAGEDLPRNGNRRSYLRGRHSPSADGRLTVVRAGGQDSSLLTPFADATCFIEQPPGHEGRAGDPVRILPL